MPALIPASRLVTWTPGTHTGVRGGVPTRTQYGSTIAATGLDQRAEIQAALDACPEGQAVVLGVGTFQISMSTAEGSYGIGLRIPANKSLRGSGRGTTILAADGGHSIFISMGNGAPDYPFPLSGNLLLENAAKGATVIKVNLAAITRTYDGFSGLDAADFLFIAQAPPDTTADPTLIESSVSSPGGWYRRQLVAIESINVGTNEVTIWPPLYSAMTTARAAQAHVVAYRLVEGSGVEDLTVDLTNCTATSNGNGINLMGTYNAFLKNVEVKKATSYGAYVECSLHTEITGCFFNQIKNQGSNGAGVLFQHSSAVLFENNAVYKSFPNIEVNFGTSGCVFAYNFFKDGSAYDHMGQNINSNHGPHNHFNLYEGNWLGKFMSDGFFGSNSEDTLFRNRIHGTNEGAVDENSQKLDSICIALKRLSRRINIVGNVVGMPQVYWTVKSGYTAQYSRTDQHGYEYPVERQNGYANIGNNGYEGTASLIGGTPWPGWPDTPNFSARDLDVEATLINRYNHSALAGGVPAAEALGGDDAPAASLYRSSQPSFLSGYGWPVYGPEAPVIGLDESAADIPAGAAFLGAPDPEPEPGGEIPWPTTPRTHRSTRYGRAAILA